jgi:hypothetical protein
MKEKISSFLAIIILVFVDFIFFNLEMHFTITSTFSVIYFLIISVLIFLSLEILIYNRLFNFKSSKLKIIILILFPLLISMVFTNRLQALDKFYFDSKRHHLIRSNNIYTFDKLLGWKSIPDSKSSIDSNFGDSINISIPIIFDSIGYRTVPDSLKLRSDTLDLYLGCSFTFGAQIEAQNGYPYKTSKLLGHNYINTGCLSCGEGQMIQHFESLIRKFNFKYVFIQLSPWLVDRTTNLVASTWSGHKPCPYFSDDGKIFKLNPTAFSDQRFTNRNWQNTKPSYFDRMHFIFTDGIKMEIFQYYIYQFAILKTKLGLIPKPTKRKNELERYFYDYIIDVCKKNNAIPIILKIGYNSYYPWSSSRNCNDLLQHLGLKAKIIDLDLALQLKVDNKRMSFYDLFHVSVKYHNRIIRYDSHPNEYANETFSERIYYKLKKK